MKTVEDQYYEAMLARDYRFDGKFYIGVKTTGIYCRPICPAKPKRENVEFFTNRIEAEKKGYRPCKRCHPESAPDQTMWFGENKLIGRIIRVIQTRPELTEDQLAETFDMSARHLRRIFVDEVGKTPKQIIDEERLALARKLILETNLSMTDVAFAAGFGSVRRFNSVFLERFKQSPSESRKIKAVENEGIMIGLSYRPPFDYQGLIKSYRNHQMGNLEWFEGDKMFRLISYDGVAGVVSISNDDENSKLLIEINHPDVSIIHKVVANIKMMFDLDSDPIVIANVLESDRNLKELIKQYPGVRLPSGWNPLEIAVSTILGQLVSTDMARILVNDLIELEGEDSGYIRNGKMIKLFPTAEAISKSLLDGLKTTNKRKETLKEFTRLVATGELSLELGQNPDEFIKKLLAIKGIGPWTAYYMALKVIRYTDAFPETDLILARALEIHKKEIIAKMSPWRGYVASLFWRAYTESLSKKKVSNGKKTAKS